MFNKSANIQVSMDFRMRNSPWFKVAAVLFFNDSKYFFLSFFLCQMLEEDFEKAVIEVEKLKLKEDERLGLWAFYMQSTNGDAGPKRPHDVKFKDWQIRCILRGFTREESKRIYIKKVRELIVCISIFRKQTFSIKSVLFAVLLIFLLFIRYYFNLILFIECR